MDHDVAPEQRNTHRSALNAPGPQPAPKCAVDGDGGSPKAITVPQQAAWLVSGLPHARPAPPRAHRRLALRRRHRLEVDLLLGTWAIKNLPLLDEKELAQYEAILNRETVDIYNLLIGAPVPPVRAARWRPPSAPLAVALTLRSASLAATAGA